MGCWTDNLRNWRLCWCRRLFA